MAQTQMQVIVTINTNSEAFDDDAGGETARVLRVAAEVVQNAETLETLASTIRENQDLRDINGNKVAKIAVRYTEVLGPRGKKVSR